MVLQEAEEQIEGDRTVGIGEVRGGQAKPRPFPTQNGSASDSVKGRKILIRWNFRPKETKV